MRFWLDLTLPAISSFTATATDWCDLPCSRSVAVGAFPRLPVLLLIHGYPQQSIALLTILAKENPFFFFAWEWDTPNPLLLGSPVSELSCSTSFGNSPTTRSKILNFSPFCSISCLLAYPFPNSLIFFLQQVLLAAGGSAAIGQLSKPFTSVLLYGKDLDFRATIQAGGFPSTHSSVLCPLHPLIIIIISFCMYI